MLQVESLETRRLLAGEPGSGAGSFDRSFGDGGSVKIENAIGRAAALRDGRFVTAASSADGSVRVMRYSPLGVLDRTFGENGAAGVSFLSGKFNVKDITTDLQGRVYLAGGVPGVAGGDIAVARLTTTGALDSTFDGDGRRVMDFGELSWVDGDIANRILVRNDGRIVLGGSALIRLTSSGKRDTSFAGGDGVVHTSRYGEMGEKAVSNIEEMEFTRDGRIVFLGTSLAVRVNRFLSDGTPDLSYGTAEYSGIIGGAVGPDLPRVFPMVVFADMSVLVMYGYGGVTLNPDGVKADFQTFEATSIPVYDGWLTDAAVQRDGKVVVAFADPRDYIVDLGVARYNTDGTPDQTFGASGVAFVGVGGPGNILLAGDRVIVAYEDGTDDLKPGGGMLRVDGSATPFVSHLRRRGDEYTFTLDDRDDSVLFHDGYYSSDLFSRMSINGFGYSIYTLGEELALQVQTRGGNDRIDMYGEDGIATLTIDAGDGNDRVQMVGVDFAATLRGGDGNDTIHAGQGNDVIEGGGGKDRIWAGDGDDEVTGNAGNDRIFGEDGEDALNGGTGNDTLDGGAGRDALFGQDGHDLLLARDDEIDQLHGGGGRNTLEGDATDVILDR